MHISSKHQNIDFTVEQENVSSLSFLDVKICRKNGKFLTSNYRKATLNGVSTNYKSFISTYQKRGFLHTLLHRSFSICCDFKAFHFEIDHLRTILIKNNYTLNFIDLCIIFLNKLYTPKLYIKAMFPNVPKRKVNVLGKYFVSNSKEASKISQ